MDQTWKILSYIGTVVGITAAILAVYYTHKRNMENRIREIETKLEHHEKYIKLMENKGLTMLEKSMDKLESK